MRALPRVMLITDADLADPVTPLLTALAAVDPAEVLVQVRLKSWSPAARRDAAERLTRTGAPVVINSDLTLASALGAGAHLPSRGETVTAARAALREGAWIGRSCHNAEELARAEADGASYVTLGPVGPVPHKGDGHGVAWLVDLAQRTRLPVFALGGVSESHIPALRTGGAHGVALMRSVPASASPASTLRELLALTR
jgi:thiamine-phosphate diphosphorylase